MIELPTVRTSERGAFRRCPQKWWWAYRLGLTPKHRGADALWFGIGVHEALAKWYGKGKKRGPHPADTFLDWIGDEEAQIPAAYADHERAEDERAKYEDARELGEAMLVSYVEEYGKDEQWNVIAIEQSFSVRVTRNGEPIANFASTFDGVVYDEEDGQFYLIEHKTASSINTAYLALDDQAGAYWAVAGPLLKARGIMKEDQRLAGIQYNFLRKTKGDDRPRNEGGAYLNKDGSVSKKQPPRRYVREVVERLPVEQRSQMSRLADEVRIMNGMRSGELPVTKSTTKDCTFCEFFIMCQLHERGGDSWKEVAKADFTRRNPYEDSRKSASW